jgi:hypothetical protein
VIFILYKKPVILNLLIDDSNISLIGTDSLGPDKVAKEARVTKEST